jgi:hypothetical protein
VQRIVFEKKLHEDIFFRGMKHTLLMLAFARTTSLPAADTPKPVGTHGVVGTLADPKAVARLDITKPGV